MVWCEDAGSCDESGFEFVFGLLLVPKHHCSQHQWRYRGMPLHFEWTLVMPTMGSRQRVRSRQRHCPRS